MCKSFRVSSMADSVFHVIILLYHLHSGSNRAFVTLWPLALWSYGAGPMALALWPIFLFQEILEIDKISHSSIFFLTLSCNY